MIPTSSIMFVIISLVMHQVHALKHFCANVQELRYAMKSVQPGDEIVLASGTLFRAADVAQSDTGAHFTSDVDGTSNQPIIMRSESPANRATLSGDNVGNLHVMRLFGDNWNIKDIIFTHAQKGIVLDHANNVQIVGCEVHYIGMEAIHVRDGSQNTLIEDCFIHDTGQSTPGFGEAIYVGSDGSVWGKYDPHVNGTIVRGCTIGPDIRAEAFDVKEGTAETIIENNIVNAEGISGSNYADAFIDLKGTRTYVRYNVFYQNGAEKLKKAIGVVHRPVPSGDMSTYEHTIHDNIFHLDDSSIDLVHAYSGFRDIYAFNNLPIDGAIADGIYQMCCPPWYTPPRNQTIVCVPPVGYYASFITNTSAILSWAGYAASFTIRYSEIGSALVQELSTLNNTLMLNGLDYNVTYEWSVRSNCETSSSNFTNLDTFTTGTPDGGPPPYSDGSAIIYDEGIGDFWNDYSFAAAPDFLDTSDSRYGSNAIKCNYGSYGGLNLKRSEALDARNFSDISFWAKGDSTVNGAGQVALRLKVNNDRIDFSILNDNWQNYQFSLDNFGNPSSIDSVTIQNDVGSDRVVYFDQIELIQDQRTPAPFPSARPSELMSRFPSLFPTNILSSSPSKLTSAYPSSAPTLSPSPSNLFSRSPSARPSKLSSANPSFAPTLSLSVSPSEFSSGSPSASPQGPIDCGPSCISIYDDTLQPEWIAKYSFKCEYDLSFQEDSAVGSTSIRVSYGRYGALYLKHSSGLSTTGLSFLRFWMKGEEAGYDVRVKVDGKRYELQTSAEWELVTIPLAEFRDPDTIKKIHFQSASKNNRIILFDSVNLF